MLGNLCTMHLLTCKIITISPNRGVSSIKQLDLNIKFTSSFIIFHVSLLEPHLKIAVYHSPQVFVTIASHGLFTTSFLLENVFSLSLTFSMRCSPVTWDILGLGPTELHLFRGESIQCGLWVNPRVGIT